MNVLDGMINQWVSKVQSLISKEVVKKLPTITNEIAQEAMQMYDTFIDEYYNAYSPTSYIRHMYRGEGFSMGLYDANNIRATNTGVFISLNGEKMMDDYEYDSADAVFDTVARGIRGVPEYWWTTWTMNYEGKYFSYSGNDMTKAFNIFVDKAVPEIVNQRVSTIIRAFFK